MRIVFLLCCLVTISVSCTAQTAQQIDDCKNQIARDPDSVIPLSVCSESLGQLSPNDQVAGIWVSGFDTISDGVLKSHRWPSRLSSTLLLADAKKLYKKTETEGKIFPDEAAALPSLRGTWEEMRDAYCEYHPGDAYSDLADREQLCPEANGHLANSAAATAGPPASPLLTAPLSVHLGKTCQRAITFAIVGSNGLAYRLPNISTKWLDKAQRKKTGICFTQYGAHSGQRNFLVVLSTSSTAFNGLQPVFHRSTAVSPVSGSGTLTDNAGATWDFTYQGTVTTTTTAETNLPYTDTTGHLYANAYDEDGSLVGSSERSVSSRQGGDPSSAFGYNLTSALLSIHVKEHLIEEIVKKISTQP